MCALVTGFQTCALPISAGSVGLLALKPGRSQKKELYSAAQNVAALFATGTFALLLELERIGYWLVAVHEGAVVARTDRFYLSREDAGQVLDELRLAYPHLLVLGAPNAPAMPSLATLETAERQSVGEGKGGAGR